MLQSQARSQRTTAVLRHSCPDVPPAQTPLKVIHIYKDFDIYNGLIEEFYLLAKMLDREKYTFKVCAFNHRHSTLAKHFLDCGGTLDSLDSRWESNPLIIYRLYKYLRREQPHIVQTYILKPNLYGRIAALLAGVPVIISTELTLKNQAHSVLSRLRDVFLHPLNAFLNRYTDVILCASEAIGKEWTTKRLSRRIQVLTPYFNSHKLRDLPAYRDKHLGGSNGDWVIGTVGRLSEEKRHIDLVEAFQEVLKIFPNASLVIVGDGDLKDRLMTVVSRRGLSNKVTFAGFQENVYEYLVKMDLFVLPSRTEGFPLALLEAMTVGLPVIATWVGGIPELVRNNETGLLVKPLKPKELAKAMIELLLDPPRMGLMGKKGKERVLSSFSADKFIRQHESVYEAALTAKGILAT